MSEMLFLFHRRAKFSWLLRIQWRTSPMWHCWSAMKGTLITSTALLRWEHFALFWPWFFLEWPHLTWLKGLWTVSFLYPSSHQFFWFYLRRFHFLCRHTATGLFKRFIFSYLDCSNFLTDLTVSSPHPPPFQSTFCLVTRVIFLKSDFDHDMLITCYSSGSEMKFKFLDIAEELLNVLTSLCSSDDFPPDPQI